MPSVNMEFGTATNFIQLSKDEVLFVNFVPKPAFPQLWSGDMVLCQKDREFRRYVSGVLQHVVTFDEVGK